MAIEPNLDTEIAQPARENNVTHSDLIVMKQITCKWNAMCSACIVVNGVHVIDFHFDTISAGLCYVVKKKKLYNAGA